MQKDDNIIFVCGCFRTRWYAKRWFPKDGVRRVGLPHELVMLNIMCNSGLLKAFAEAVIILLCKLHHVTLQTPTSVPSRKRL